MLIGGAEKTARSERQRVGRRSVCPRRLYPADARRSVGLRLLYLAAGELLSRRVPGTPLLGDKRCAFLRLMPGHNGVFGGAAPARGQESLALRVRVQKIVDRRSQSPGRFSQIELRRAGGDRASRVTLNLSSRMPCCRCRIAVGVRALADDRSCALQDVSVNVLGGSRALRGPPAISSSYSTAPHSLSSVMVLLWLSPPNSSAYPKGVHSTISPGRS